MIGYSHNIHATTALVSMSFHGYSSSEGSQLGKIDDSFSMSACIAPFSIMTTSQ